MSDAADKLGSGLQIIKVGGWNLRLVSGVETEGSDGPMNRAPKLIGATKYVSKKIIVATRCQNVQNSIQAGGPPRPRWGNLTDLPRVPIAGSKGA